MFYTLLSQCGTFIALRLSNTSDRNKIQGTLPDNLAGVIDSLPILRTGEAIITGDAARLPIRCRITLPSEENRPSSEDPNVSEHWAMPRIKEDYERIAASWRAQNPRWAANRPQRENLTDQEIKSMERELVSSSNIASIGYDSAAETLEVEFLDGSVYQYYNVPQALYQQFMEAGSKGKFLHANIRNAYAYSRV